MTRPTYFENNEFTSIFQTIVDTYGVPNYKEANPAVFACVTFPFLFGVMFGDIMHGSMLLAFSIFLCLVTPSKGSILEAAKPLRYFALLMGIFSTFCGLCYNEFSSIPLYLWGDSCWKYSVDSLEPTTSDECVYPIGVDPSWYLSTNELTFMNSMKMKMSVIFGVAQMALGIFLKGSNAVNFSSPIDFLFEFMPQITMLMVLFGFMDLMIVTKWLTSFAGKEAYAPSVISMMIDMFLNGGEPTNPTDLPLFKTAEQQKELMNLLLYITLICVPLMLVVKPVWIGLTSKREVHEE